MDLVKIRTEFARALSPGGIYLGDDSTVGVFVEDHEPDKAELPVAFLGFPGDIAYSQNMRDGTRLDFELFLLVDRAESKYAQLRLASAVSLVDTRASIEAALDGGSADGIYIPSIKQLLENHDPNGAWHSLALDRATRYGTYDVGAVTGLGVTFPGRMSVLMPAA